MKIDMQPKGPEAIRARMAEIQSKLNYAFPTPAATASFGGTLSGKISGLQPFDPFGKGLSVESMPTPQNLKGLIERSATEAGLDPVLFDALVAVESSYDPNARSSAGAMGLTQLMPSTAKAMGVQNAFDPEQNLRGGAKYLSQMMNQFGGDVQLALAAYNAGPSAVEKYNGIPAYKQTQEYVKKIMALYSQRANP